MLKSDISLALTKGKLVRQIAAELAENFMADPKLLKSELQGRGQLGRKAFCEFMGIGESTLTGWLQAERIPQTAAVAYMLLLISQVLQEKCRALEDKESEPRIIALGGRYAVVRFDASEKGQGLGQVIASDIPDLISARRVAFSQSKRMTQLIDRHLELIDDQIELTDQAGNNPAWLQSERASLQQLITHFYLGAEEKKLKSKT
jgi:hypothetical protein